jgi:PEP-CTERM motif
VLIRPRVVRRIVIVVAVLLVSGAAAAMKLTSWTPASMCFCPTSDHPDSAVKSDSGIEAVAPSDGFKVPLDTSTTAHHRNNSGAFGAAPVVALAETSSHGKGHEGGKWSWTPWGKHSSHRWASASTSGPSASLGSLWKMMSLAGRAHNGTETTARVAPSASARSAGPKAPASPRPKAPASISSPPSNSSSDPGTSALAAPPGSAFSEDSTPVAELVSGGSSSGATPGALGSGSSARAAAAASNMASNPEPASFALIATGLLGIAGLLRRRRV